MKTEIQMIYIGPSNGHWRITSEMPNQVFGTFDTQEEAITLGRCIAKIEHGQMVVCGSNGYMEFAEDYASAEG